MLFPVVMKLDELWVRIPQGSDRDQCCAAVPEGKETAGALCN